MTGYMNIRITVAANQARKAIADTESQVSRLNARMAAAGTGTEQFARKQDMAFKAMNKWGNQLQWTGRQLEYNWSLPLAVAGAAATKFALDVDRSMTQVRKVYGDSSIAAATQVKELAALEKAFVALSNRYGIHQKEVADIAAGWAAAGASGLALAKNTELTMKTMIIGEMDAAEATQALIAIQAQYGLTADQLGDTMARLNAIENETGTNTQDLVVAFRRAAGMARVTGVDVQHLGAMIAAITPAAGTATQAGNALKTIFQRLFSPTREANRVLDEIGISTAEMSWQTANAAVRLETLAGKWNDLSDSQRSVVASTLVGIEQGNRFVVLMEEMNRETGFYSRALRAAADDADYFKVSQDELNKVLDSSSHKWDQAIIILQNAMIKVIQPLLPMIIGLAQEVGQAATAFADLNPNLQKLIVFGALGLALLGPLVRYFGSLFTLIAVLGRAITGTAMGFGALAGMLGLTGRAAKTAAASTATAAATSAAAAATATGAATAASGGVLARMAAGIRAGSASLLGVFTTLFAAQIATAKTGATGIVGGYSSRLRGLVPATKARMLAARAAMLAGATGMVTAFAGRMNTLLLPSFGATLGRMSLLWNMHLVRMTATMQGRMAVMMAWWGVSWRTGMLGTMRTALVGMVMSMAAGMAAMMGPLARWAVFAGRNWTFIWTGMLDKMFVALTRMTAVWYAGTSRLHSIGLVFGYAWSALWSGIATATTRIWTLMNTGLLRISQLGYAKLIALTAAFRTNMSILFSLLAFRLRGLWIALTNGLNKIWALGLLKMRALWTAFIAFLSSPAKLMAAFAKLRVIFMAGMSGIMGVIAGFGSAIVAILTSPWTLAIAAVIGLIILFRDQLKQVWDNIVEYFSDANNAVVEAFNQLPEGIKNAVLKVVAIVRAAAMKVYELFSYLNPFARHSPSLVENVTNGMAVIRSQFGTLMQIEGPINSAYASIKRLKNLTADMRNGEASFKIAEDIEKLSKAAPQAIPAYRQLVAIMADLSVRQERLSDAISEQERRNKALKSAIDASAAALDHQKDILSDLEEVANGYKDQIEDLRGAISDLASTPLTGMGAMEDAIFNNEMAQKRLRLEMMRMEDAGATYDDIKDKIASLNGELDMMRGEQDRLRGMGAGSDILGHYDEQIKKLEDQKAAIEQSSAPIAEMASELEKLQREAERMDLEKSLAFDPLTRQIDKAANAMQEMPFDQVIGQIRQNQAAIDQLTPAYDAANRAVAAQQAAVDAAQASHDALQASFDLEQEKLEALREAYQAVSDAISDVNTNLGDMRSAADSAIKQAEGSEYISPAVENFRNAAGGNYADVGGDLEEAMKLGREGGLGDQSADIEAWTKDIEDQLADSFGGMDMWSPFKDMWKSVVKWWDANVGPWISALGDFFGTIFDDVDFVTPLKDSANGIWDKVFGESLTGMDWGGIGTKISDGFQTALSVLSTIGTWLWDLFGEEVTGTFSQLWQGIKDGASAFGDVLGQLGERVRPFMDAVQNLWTVIGILLTPVVISLMAALQVLWSVLNGMLGPVLDWIIGVFKNVWQVVIGLIDIFIGLFTLDFGRFFGGLGGALKGLWGLVWDTIVSLGIVIVNGLGALVNGLWDSFMWVGKMIWEGLEAGLNAIGLGWLVDVFGAIIDWVKDLFGINSPSTVFAEIGGFLMEGLVAGLKGAWNILEAIFKTMFDLIKGIFEVIGAVVTWLWKNIYEPAFSAIGAIIEWLWNSVVKPVFGFIVEGIKTWAAIINWIWDSVVKPVFGFIGDIFNWIWDSIIKPIIGFIVEGIKTWAAIINWLWDNVAKPVFGFIGSAFEVLGRGIAWVWSNVIKPAWGAIETAIGFLWNSVLKPVFDSIANGFRVMGDGIAWVWNNIVKPAWDALKDGVKGVADWVGEKFQWMQDKVLSIFTTIRDWVGLIWGGLVDTVKAPIKIVFDFVNNHIIDNLNKLTDKFGLHIDHIDYGFATGGIVPGGYSPGRDNKIVAVGSGEAIMRPEWTRAVGSGYINAANAAARYGGVSGVQEFLRSGGQAFANGGIVDALTGSRDIGGPWSAAKNLGGKLVDGAGNLVDATGKVVGAVADGVGDAVTWTGEKVADLAKKGVGYALEHIIKPVGGWITDNLPEGFARDFSKGVFDKTAEMAKKWGDDRTSSSIADGGQGGYRGAGTPAGDGTLGTNWASLFATVKARIPQARLNSGVRNTPDAHGRGKAVDFGFGTGPGGNGSAGLASIASLLYNEYGKSLYELIYTGIGDSTPDIKNSRNHVYDSGTNAQHKNHVHAAVYDRGGVLASHGFAMNMSGKAERVLSPRQTAAFERLVTILDTVGIPSVAAMEAAIFRAEARAQQAETIGSQTIIQNEGDTNITMNFYGELAFPNITDADDADTFIQNLSDLAGGRR